MRKLLHVFALFLVALMAACSPPSGTGSSGAAAPPQAEESTDLADLIASGAVSIVNATGNGSSSGNSIDAVLRNNTGRAIEVDVFMRQPIFLTNSGAGQNMIANMVVGGDGGYMQSESRSFIELKPSAELSASMVAYCVDFEKENPTAQESFAVAPSPSHLVQVMSRVNAYAKANPNADVTKAAQVAVWMAQGESPDKIAEKFDFTAADEQLARQFLQ